MDVELGRMLTTQSGPQWQAHVRELQRLAQSLGSGDASPSHAAQPTEQQWRLAFGILATLVWEKYGPQDIGEIVAANLADSITTEQSAALDAVCTFLWPRVE